MNPSNIQLIGTILFVVAILHTFSASYFQKIAHKYKEGSVGENFFHFMGEVEVVFGMWAGIFILFYSVINGFIIYDESHHHVIGGALGYLEGLNYTEPAFVFVIMCMAGTRPIILLAEQMILIGSKTLPLPKKMSFYVTTMVLGPLLGSFITEPAAMTVTAMILLDYFYSSKMSTRFKYATIGLLFVNVSVGGTLTHFAAPPVLMVASKWGWGIAHMMEFFGYKAALAVILSTIAVTLVFKKELSGKLEVKEKHTNRLKPPIWVSLLHIFFLAMVVYTAHHMVFFMGLFLFFLGFVAVSSEYQDEVKLKESLLVGFFLAGLVTLGSVQSWWLQPLLVGMSDLVLYLGATGLTAITDNAALTYLGSLVELSDSAKYNLVAGAVSGGGLTVIANAPNPAGYGILKGRFDDSSISPLGLLLAAIGPTIIVCLCFQLLPDIG